MSTAAVDYDSLAKQHAGVDYDALASTHGGKTSGGEEPGAGTLEFAKSIGSGLFNSPIELAKGAYHSLSGDNSGFKADEKGNIVPSGTDPQSALISKAKEMWQQLQSGDLDGLGKNIGNLAGQAILGKAAASAPEAIEAIPDSPALAAAKTVLPNSAKIVRALPGVGDAINTVKKTASTVGDAVSAYQEQAAKNARAIELQKDIAAKDAAIKARASAPPPPAAQPVAAEPAPVSPRQSLAQYANPPAAGPTSIPGAKPLLNIDPLTGRDRAFSAPAPEPTPAAPAVPPPVTIEEIAAGQGVKLATASPERIKILKGLTDRINAESQATSQIAAPAAPVEAPAPAQQSSVADLLKMPEQIKRRTGPNGRIIPTPGELYEAGRFDEAPVRGENRTDDYHPSISASQNEKAFNIADYLFQHKGVRSPEDLADIPIDDQFMEEARQYGKKAGNKTPDNSYDTILNGKTLRLSMAHLAQMAWDEFEGNKPKYEAEQSLEDLLTRSIAARKK